MTEAQNTFARKAPALIMYDLDGTLVDSVPDLAIAIDLMLADLGMPQAGEDKVRLWVGNGIPVMVQRALADDINGDQPGRVDKELFNRALPLFEQYYDRELGLHSYLYPGVQEFLQTMTDRGVKQAVVTNKSEQFTEKLLKLKLIDQHFSLLLGGDSLEEKKPHPLPLLHVCKHFAISKEQSLMIGDSSNDIKAARAAGITVYALPYGYNHGLPIEQSNPDLVIDTLDQLL